MEKKLQLIVCQQLIDEYLGIFRDVLEMEDDLLSVWQRRWTLDRRTTVVNPGRRFTQSRDPDDNVLLAAAYAGRAKYLVTNDRDLLDLPKAFLKTLPFQVVAPAECLRWLEV
jgi:putative PIN family toxin of toxin-antitoxin system